MASRDFIYGVLLIFSVISNYHGEERTWSITEQFANGKYIVTRNVELDKKSIQFIVDVETTGFVGFGLSPNGAMQGADIVIGGVFKNGTKYFNDFHGVGRTNPVIDDHEDWHMESITENGTHTSLTFNRTFDTCDNQDIEITEDTVNIIWSFGDSDEIKYHKDNRGTQSRNLLDPPMPSKNISSFKKWDVIVGDIMPTADTSYMCSLHKMPAEISETHHIVGFDALLENEEALAHTHHFIFRKCTVLPQHAEYFAENAGKPGVECGHITQESELFITQCSINMFAWAKGGQITTFPDNVGFPIAENPAEPEYYVFEVHYDNPKEIADLRFKTGLRIYHTEELRPEIAGIMVIGHLVWWAHTIPPNSPNFKTIGHCSSECTTEALPDEGINVFNVLLHSHLSGRKLKLRHFRDEEELPWLSVDQNYNFDYQQNRHLKQERRIMKGDHLTYECVTNTEWKNGELTIGELSTRDEMCEAFVMYYPRVEMVSCMSSYSTDDLLLDFGMENYTLVDGMNIPIITGPDNMSGRNYTDVLTNVVEWTEELRNSYQSNVISHDHDFACYSDLNPDFLVWGTTNYPPAKEYQPENECPEFISTTTESGGDSTTTEDVSTTTEDVSTTTEDVSTTTEDVSTTTEGVSTTTEDVSVTTEGVSTTTGNGASTTDSGITTTTGNSNSGNYVEWTITSKLFVILGILCQMI